MITANSIDEAYESLVWVCKEQGNMIVDERNDTLYQVPFTSVQFNEKVHQRVGDLWSIDIPTGVNPNLLKDYSQQLLDPNLNGFVYTYGNRFRKWFNDKDQFQYMLDKLRENKFTRRAVSLTWDVKNDTQESEVPCLQLIKLSIVDNKLVMTVVFRSNDLKYAFKYNMYALLKLQQWFATELGIEPSNFYYVGLDLHYKVI